MLFPESTCPRGAANAVRRGLFYFFLAVCACVISTSSARAQNAAISGLITDPSGALVQHAQVTLTNQSTHAVWKIMSDDNGLYNVPRIAAGTYTMQVDAPGFKHYEQTGIAINSAQTLALDAHIQLGSAAQSVTVYGSNLPPEYAGGQVATGASLGVLGNKDVMDIPFNITSYTSQLIQNQQARSVADVAANDPSVRQAWISGGYTDQFYIRGYPVAAQDISIDGVYGVSPYQIATTDWLERVQILKGASGFLSGMAPSGDVGGVINLIPKHAVAPIAELTVSYLSDKQFGGHLDIGQRFGAEKQTGIRFNGTFKNGDTERDRQSQKLGAAFLDIDHQTNRFRLFTDLGYQHQLYKAPTRFTYIAAGVKIPSAPRASSNWEPDWSYFKGTDLFAIVRGEGDLSKNWSAYAIAGVRRNTSGSAYGQSSITDTAGDITGTYYTQPTWALTYSGQAGIRGKASTGPIQHEINIGYSTLYNNYGGRITYLTGTYKSNIYKPILYSAPDLSSVYLPVLKNSELFIPSYALADTLSAFHERILLTLGGRYQRVQSHNYDQNTGAITASYDRHAITPAAGLVIKPMSKVSLYGSYIEGLSPGPTAPTTALNAGEVFPPIKSKQGEGGVKVDFGHLGGSISFFQITLPSGVSDPTTQRYAVNGQQRNRGIELNTFGEIRSGLRILGGASFMDAEMTQSAGGTLNGKHPVGVPSVQTNLGAEWDTPFAKGLTLTTRYVHTSGGFVDAANTQATTAWNTGDIGARYTFEGPKKPITIRADINNLFGVNYWSASQFGQLELAEPRVFRFSASYNF